jgi:hypothetical protein
MIRSIEIENFKSIGNRTKFELSDITLLYGPNSAGKSSLVLALHYLRSILCDHDLDPEYIDLDGEQIQLGGFGSLVHGRNLNNSISIDVTLDANDGLQWVDLTEFFLQPRDYPVDKNLRKLLELTRERTLANRERGECEFWQFPDHGQVGPLPLAYQPKVARFSLTISWDRSQERPRVNCFATFLDDIPILQCKTDRDEFRGPHARLSPKLINILPLQLVDFSSWMRAFDSPPKTKFDKSWESTEKHLRNMVGRGPKASTWDSTHLQGGELLTRFRDEWEKLRSIWHSIESKGSGESQNWVKTGGKLSKGGFEWPSVGPSQSMFSLLGWNDSLVYTKHDGTEGLAFNSLAAYCGILSTTIQASISQTLERRFLHLGPLREHPNIGDRSGLRHPKASWLRGLQAWQLVLENSTLCEKASEWLESKGKFSAGHALERTAFTSFSGSYDEVVESVKNSPSQARTRSSEKFGVVVRDRHGLYLQSREVGTGISQVVPVIVAALNNPGLCFIEQPELHLHPKMQLAIADLLIEMRSFWNAGSESHLKRQCIVETHSEHIALRLLRRIRESGEVGEKPSSELCDSPLYILPEQISVLYALPTDNGLQIQRLRVDETGEFIDRWPSGFFDERAEELF